MKKRKKQQSTLFFKKKKTTDDKENDDDDYIRKLSYSRIPMTQAQDAAEAAASVSFRDENGKWMNEKQRYYKEFPQFKPNRKIRVDRIKRVRNEKWKRPQIKPEDYYDEEKRQHKPITYQQCGIDYFTKFDRETDTNEIFIRSYGVTEKGHSVCCVIKGFKPYFYVHMPDWFHRKQLPTLRLHLDKYLKDNEKKTMIHDMSIEYHVKVEGLQLQRTNTGELKPIQSTFVKIELTDTNALVFLRKYFESIDSYTTINLGYDQKLKRRVDTYESNIPYELRFMVDKEMSDFYWLSANVNDRSFPCKQEKISTCQLEFTIDHNALEVHQPVGKWQKVAPFRFLVFDIECISENKHFPTPEKDKVCSIANRVFEHGCKVDKKGVDECIQRNVFHMGDSDNLGDGIKSYPFETEEELLVNWCDYVRDCDPDFIVGYNSVRFDIRYLLDRANRLGFGDYFSVLGRLKKKGSSLKKTVFSSSAYGTTVTYRTNLYGRYQLDVYEFIKREMKLGSYTLNNLSKLLLGDQKYDVHHSVMGALFNGGKKSRAMLYKYNDKDVVLTSQILNKQLIFMNAVGMCRVTGVPFKYLIERGQGIKTYSKLLRNAKLENILIRTRTQEEKTSSQSYPGAKVFDPLSGFYDDPVSVWDFYSLYPCVIIANNLCWTTKVTMEQIIKLGLKESDYIKSPSGAYFVKKHIREGLLPRLVADLLKKRGGAKNEMKKHKGTPLEAVYNGKQLALKVTANSSYGFTGARTGILYDMDIAWAVTSLAKDMILKTAKMAEEKLVMKNKDYYFKKCGVMIKHPAKVIYGDTDSVMVLLKGLTVEEAEKLSKVVSAEITTVFNTPNKLEYEKTYKRYLLVGKKRYAGLKKEYGKWKIETKGLETVRRDNHKFTKEILQGALDRIMFDGDVKAMMKFIRNKCRELLSGKVGIHKLVLSQSLKRIEDYKSNPAHLQLAKRMIKRDPATAPRSGDRIYYLMTKKSRKLKKGDIIEDPRHVMKYNIPIDYGLYLEKMKKPISNMIKYVILKKGDVIDKTGMDGKQVTKAREKERKIAEKMIFVGPEMRVVKNDAAKRYRPYFYIPKPLETITVNDLDKHIINKKNTCYVKSVEVTNSTDKLVVSDSKRFLKITFSGTEAMLLIKKAIKSGQVNGITADTTIYKATLGLSAGIFNHFVRTETCMRCKGKIKVEAGGVKIHRSICNECKPYKKVILRRIEEDHNKCDGRINDMKDRCRKCQGNLPIKINCSNGDCDIFYERGERVNDLDCIKMDMEGLQW